MRRAERAKCALLFLPLTAFLSSCVSSGDGDGSMTSPPPPAFLPESVCVKTGKLTFNGFFDFALDDEGRIWWKPNSDAKETAGLPRRWRLMGSGLPENEAKRDFAKPKRIVSIHADADEVMAVSDERRQYSLRWLKNPVFPGTPGKWTDVHGWPVEEPWLWTPRVLGNRGWGIGRRNQVVETFEDADGKSFTGGGGLTTYYFLSADGTEVFFADSGLPADQSHTFAGPLRGRFVAVGFDVSASTMFVIGERGEMWTRMADFDTVGSDIMFFDYTYDRRNKRKNTIAVPGEDWLPHAKIALSGKARISSQITIALTGKRNAGRELRVAGTDAEGRTGYYRKPIFFQKEGSPVREEARTWEFRAVSDLAIDPARFLDSELVRRADPAPLAPSRDVRMEGKLEIDGKAADLALELADWNLVASPAVLRLSSGEEKVDLAFHTVEEWFHLKRLDPGRDGTPKKLIGTLEVPQAAWATRNARLRAALEDLRPYDLRDFAFWVEATNDYVLVETRRRPWGGKQLGMSFARAGAGFRTVESARRQSLRRDGFTLAASSQELRVARPLASLGEADRFELADKIVKNESARTHLKNALVAPSELDAQTPFYITGRGVQVVKALGALLGGASFWAPYVKNLMGETPSLIAKNDELKETALLVSREDGERALSILETRIAAYSRRLAELEGKASPGKWVHHETLAGWWSELRFGRREARARGTLDRSVPACRLEADDADLASATEKTASAGIVLEAVFPAAEGSPEGKLRFLVSPRELGKRVFERSLDGPVAAAGRPLELEVRVALDYEDDVPAVRTLLRSMLSKPDELRAEEARGKLAIEDGRYRLSLDGFEIAWER